MIDPATVATRVERIGNATLYLADSRDVLPLLSRPDLILSDPPYGQQVTINIRLRHQPEAGRYTTTGSRNVRRQQKQEYPAAMIGDDVDFDPSWLVEAAPKVLLWGAHRFYSRLPDHGRLLIWDKVPNGKERTQGDGEAAWFSQPGPLRMFRHLWDGLSIAAGYETKVERRGAAAAARVHPTQKPVDLMLWCIDRCALPVGSMIYDPYMGGGSTGIAAAIAGMRFVGVEIEPVYFDAACRRIEHAQRHVDHAAAVTAGSIAQAAKSMQGARHD